MFSLGIILFELYFAPQTDMERMILITDLKDKYKFPKDFEIEWKTQVVIFFISWKLGMTVFLGNFSTPISNFEPESSNIYRPTKCDDILFGLYANLVYSGKLDFLMGQLSITKIDPIDAE